MLTADERLILNACKQQADAIPGREPPKWLKYSHHEWEAEAKHGPRYRPTEWFGKLTNAQRQKLLRTVHRLRDRGLVEGTGGEAGQLLYLKITANGEAALLEIAAHA
jgi:hypothetical protein